MPTNSPLITTIIPTYKRPQLLKRAIRSVLNQTFTDFQICVYDNASGDETPQVVAELAKEDPRVKYYCHPKNIGALNNFNYGLLHVETPFFSFLSDDDIVLQEFFETALKGFEKYPDAMFSCGATIVITPEGKIIDVPVDLWTREGYFLPSEGIFEMIGGKHPAWTAILFRKKVIEKVGILNKDIPAGDLDFELRIAARFPFMITKKPCAFLTSHPSSISASGGFNIIWPGWPKMINNLVTDIRIPLEIRIHVEKMLTIDVKKRLFGLGIKSIYQKNFIDTFEVAKIFRQEYHMQIEAFILIITAKMCEHLYIIHRLYILAYKYILLSSMKRKNSIFQDKFGEYAKYLL